MKMSYRKIKINNKENIDGRAKSKGIGQAEGIDKNGEMKTKRG
jgi:hypothetical protein